MRRGGRRPAIVNRTSFAAAAALAFASAGAALPLAQMLHGALVEDARYAQWTWPAIPAVWAVSALGVWQAARGSTAGGLLVVLGAAGGIAAFWQEFGAVTFGGAWLCGAYLYLRAGRRRGYLGGPPLPVAAPPTTPPDRAAAPRMATAIGPRRDR